MGLDFVSPFGHYFVSALDLRSSLTGLVWFKRFQGIKWSFNSIERCFQLRSKY